VAGLLRRHPARLPRLALALPALLRFAAGRADHGALKAAFISASIGGLRRAEIEDGATRYVAQLLTHGVRRDALATLEAHRRAGDTLVLMSASPDLYVPQIAHALGMDEAICTQLHWAGDELVGSLASPNCRGAEKARRLELLRARYPQLPVVAYGNAASDLAHLALVERGVLVNGSAGARRAARPLGVQCVLWR
jgi:phosphatidylglycerophosphatase C